MAKQPKLVVGVKYELAHSSAWRGWQPAVIEDVGFLVAHFLTKFEVHGAWRKDGKWAVPDPYTKARYHYHEDLEVETPGGQRARITRVNDNGIITLTFSDGSTSNMFTVEEQLLIPVGALPKPRSYTAEDFKVGELVAYRHGGGSTVRGEWLTGIVMEVRATELRVAGDSGACTWIGEYSWPTFPEMICKIGAEAEAPKKWLPTVGECCQARRTYGSTQTWVRVKVLRRDDPREEFWTVMQEEAWRDQPTGTIITRSLGALRPLVSAAAPPPTPAAAPAAHWNGTCRCGARTWSGLAGMPAVHDGKCALEAKVPPMPKLIEVKSGTVNAAMREPGWYIAGTRLNMHFATPAAAQQWWDKGGWKTIAT